MTARMAMPLRLRVRVAAGSALLGLVVSACLAFVAVHFSDSYVHRLIDEMLRVEGDYLRERFAADPALPLPRSRHFSVYLSDASGAHAPPPDYAELAPGLHEIEDAPGERHVAVYEAGARRLYVVLDIGLESKRERRLARDLGALVLIGGALSCWLGWFFAGRAIAPVRRLAERVERIDPPGRGIDGVASEFADDEVGALAAAFDRYQQRLQEYVRRERAFTADASHELRTPLAVIQGAIEVLLDDAQLGSAQRSRLQRIQRGADELHDLLEALLVLARSDARSEPDERADVGEVVNTLLRERADAFGEKNLQLDWCCDASAPVAAPRRLLEVVIGNLLRAYTQFAAGGIVRLRFAAGVLAFAYECPRAAADPAAFASAANPRLNVIRRVCERRGWQLEERPEGAAACGFTLRLG
jgi:signal transduction histidine kinase